MYICIECGKELYRYRKSELCPICTEKQRKYASQRSPYEKTKGLEKKWGQPSIEEDLAGLQSYIQSVNGRILPSSPVIIYDRSHPEFNKIAAKYM